jgi:hypothetical protein
MRRSRNASALLWLLLAAAILPVFLTLTQPVPVLAARPTAECVQTDLWVYPVCDMLVERGYLPGYSTDHFDGEEQFSRREFSDVTVRLFRMIRHRTMQQTADPITNGTASGEDDTEADFEQQQSELQLIAAELYLLYSDLLSPRELELTRHNPWFHYQHAIVLHAPGLTDAQRLRLFPALTGRGPATVKTTAYDDVPIDHWGYAALAGLTEAGVLEGYPEGFFTGSRVLTRYEFAQSIARLEDIAEGMEVDPVHQTSIALLVLEFKDQLVALVHSNRDLGFEARD